MTGNYSKVLGGLLVACQTHQSTKPMAQPEIDFSARRHHQFIIICWSAPNYWLDDNQFGVRYFLTVSIAESRSYNI